MRGRRRKDGRGRGEEKERGGRKRRSMKEEEVEDERTVSTVSGWTRDVQLRANARTASFQPEYVTFSFLS